MEIYINKREIELARKLKIGDKVKIKSRGELSKFLQQNKLFYNIVESMLECAGKEFYIKKERKDRVSFKEYGEPYFELQDNDCIWSAYLFDFGGERTIEKHSLE